MAEPRTEPVSAIGARGLSSPPGGVSLWVLVLLAVYVGFWTIQRDFAQYNLDRHGDMVENFAWGITWQLGYQKHPPLFGWITALWFEIFPRTNAAYYLLSTVNMAVTAGAMWLVSRRFLTEWQQVIAVAMIFVMPPLSFHALDYNANAGMMPFWTLAFLFYLRTIEKQRLLDACLTGLFCGLAMLAKYHSLVLAAALAAHMIWDRETRPLLKTALPWAATAIGALVVAPHAWWVVQSGFRTVTYAAEQGDGTFGSAVGSAADFVIAFLLYSLPGVIVALLYWRKRPGRAIISMPEGWRGLPATVQGRALLFIGPGSLVLTIVFALVLSAQLSSLWVIPFFFTVPILLALAVAPGNAVHIWYAAPAAVIVFCAAMAAATPWLRGDLLERATSNTVEPVVELAGMVQERWHEETGSRLAIAASPVDFLANSLSFYASDTPYAVEGNLDTSPWVTQADIERQGAVFICRAPSDASGCDAAAAGLLERVDSTTELTIPAVEGAGGPSRWGYTVFFRYPETREPASEG
ncbi:glycosyltransferase family 39 protein [Neoaquamicrobium sediminum]|uniref:glycosyltransferase family 39 protein n=1 Tax=Neoaquamicrobium sediminum TaxID=1849104 RepID=UPI003BAD03EF